MLKKFMCAAIVSLACCILAAGVSFADDPVGSVESASGRFEAERAGKTIALATGSDIFEFDIIRTGDDGAGTIRFLDDTMLELRASSEIDIKEVVSSEERDRFNVGVIEGAARVVTGEIVKRNPRGFKVTTPGATIGIRGTDLSIGYSAATTETTVDVAETEKTVSVTSRATGMSVTGVAGLSMSVSATGQATINGIACDLGNIESVQAAMEQLSEMNVGITDAAGQAVGGQDGSGGDGGGAGSNGGGGDGGNGGSGGGSNSSGGGNSGGDCGSSNSSPGR